MTILSMYYSTKFVTVRVFQKQTKSNQINIEAYILPIGQKKNLDNKRVVSHH